MPGRKKKSAEKKEPLFTSEEYNDLICTYISGIVGHKINSFIIIAESDDSDHIGMYNMKQVHALGYAEKLSLMLRNRLLVDMVKSNKEKDADNKRKQKRKKKTSNN